MGEREDRELWDPAKEIVRAKTQLVAAQQAKDVAIQAAGGYVVDPERAQGCIDELSRIVLEVRRNIPFGWSLRFEPPALDAVSLNATRAGSMMAGRAAEYVGAWANQIEATRDALQRQLDAYRSAEQANTNIRA